MHTTATQNRAAKLSAWRDGFPQAQPVSGLVARRPATCVGVIARIRLVPGESIAVTVEDGSGRLEAVWTGRQRLRGVELGRAVRLCGTVCTGPDGPLMRNPTWCLVTDPYADPPARSPS